MYSSKSYDENTNRIIHFWKITGSILIAYIVISVLSIFINSLVQSITYVIILIIAYVMLALSFAKSALNIERLTQDKEISQKLQKCRIELFCFIMFYLEYWGCFTLSSKFSDEQDIFFFQFFGAIFILAALVFHGIAFQKAKEVYNAVHKNSNIKAIDSFSVYGYGPLIITVIDFCFMRTGHLLFGIISIISSIILYLNLGIIIWIIFSQTEKLAGLPHPLAYATATVEFTQSHHSSEPQKIGSKTPEQESDIQIFWDDIFSDEKPASFSHPLPHSTSTVEFTQSHHSSEPQKIGSKIPEQKSEIEIFCPNCGVKNPPGAKFCEACGTKLV